jgi:hypothetical protein
MRSSSAGSLSVPVFYDVAVARGVQGDPELLRSAE